MPILQVLQKKFAHVQNEAQNCILQSDKNFLSMHQYSRWSAPSGSPNGNQALPIFFFFLSIRVRKHSPGIEA